MSTGKSFDPGLFLAFLATFAYCCLNVGIRWFTDAGLTVWGIMIIRGLLAMSMALIAARILKKNCLGQRKPLLLAIGLCSFSGTAILATAITMIPLYQVLVLCYLFPAMTVPQSMIINKTRVERKDLFLLAVAFLGCLVLIWPDEAAGLTLGFGHFLGVLGSFFYGLGFVLTNRLGDDNSGLEPVFYYGFWAFFGGLFMAFAMGRGTGIVTQANVWQAVGLGFLAIIPILSSYAALRWLPSHQLGIIGTLEVFGAALSSWLIFNDPITIRALFGGLIILFAALRLNR